MENNDNKLNKYKCVKVPFSSILMDYEFKNFRRCYYKNKYDYYTSISIATIMDFE
jgi:hypothetical protein